MKRYAIIFLSVLAICSCAAQNLPEKLDSFVDKAELNSDKYSSQDWEKSQEDFQILLDQFNASDKSQYTDAEKQMAARAMGRYHALLIKEGLEKTEDIIGSIGKILPEYINGLATELGNGTENLLKTLESLVDTAALDSTFKKLDKVLEGLFGTGVE